MAGIGDLIVNLGTNNTRWQRGLGSALKDVSKFQIDTGRVLATGAVAMATIYAGVRSIDALGKSQGGAWAELDTHIDNVGMGIVDSLLPAVTLATEGLNAMLAPLGDIRGSMQDFGVESAGVLSHMGEILTLTGMNWQLWGVQIAEDAKHLFGVTLPALVKWFAENWTNILRDSAVFAGTVFTNLGANFRELWDAIVSYFAGNPVEFDWTPLTEGFKAETAKLPDIPARLTTEWEESLQRDITAFTDGIGESMVKQRAELTELFKPVAETPMATITRPDTPWADFMVPEGGADDEPKADKKTGTAQLAGAMLRGSSEAYSTLVQAQIGKRDPTTKAVEDVGKILIAQVGKPLQDLSKKIPTTSIVPSFGIV